eukprot:scaffold137119_cov24-Prasinocladus_malaysianus.AAC.1
MVLAGPDFRPGYIGTHLDVSVYGDEGAEVSHGVGASAYEVLQARLGVHHRDGADGQAVGHAGDRRPPLGIRLPREAGGRPGQHGGGRRRQDALAEVRDDGLPGRQCIQSVRVSAGKIV